MTVRLAYLEKRCYAGRNLFVGEFIMTQLFLGAVSSIVHLLFFLAFGSLTLTIFRRKKEFNFFLVPVVGFFVYYGCFEILAFPMTLLLVPLHILTIAWGIISLVVLAAAAFFCAGIWRKAAKGLLKSVREDKAAAAGFLILVAVQLLFAAVYNLNSPDAAYYVGNISTSVYTDTMGRYNPYTGRMLSNFNVRYVTATYYLEQAVFCQALKVHPMVQAKTAFPMLILFLCNLLYYQIGKELFSSKRKKAVAFACGVLFFWIMTANPAVGAFLYYRTFEGKAILHGLALPWLLLIFLKLYRNERDRFWWFQIFAVSLGSVAISTSSMTLIPAAVLAGTVPLLFWRKRWSLCGHYAASVIPDILVLILYVSVNAGFLRLSAR